jgi:hypothetical protein
MATEELLVDFMEGRGGATTEVRSTLITTSMAAIRARQRFEAYEKALPKEWRDALLTAVAGMWLPIQVALAHYNACDTLGFSAQEQFVIGKEVGTRVQGSVVGLMVRTARTAGVTPWTGLMQCNRLYERMFQGGGVRLLKLGPKEARVELVKNPLVSSTHFKNGLRGLTCVGGELFAEKVYVHDLPKFAARGELGLRISWA